MTIKVVGIEKLDYFSKKRNKQVKGVSINYVDIGTKRERLDGYMVGSQFISSDNKVSQVPIEIGGVYTMYLNGYDVDYLAKCEEEGVVE